MNQSSESRACPEFHSCSRRGFLALGAIGAGVAAAADWMPGVALAKEHRGTQRDVLVVAFLRGGADALTICPPFLDNDYYAARPTLAVPRPDSASPNRAINLNGTFGFAPAMAPLLPAYQDGKLLIVHAVGSQDTTRSHFEAARLMEIGAADPASPSGWLARHLGQVPADPIATLRAMALSDGVPKSLNGAPRTLPIPDPTNFSLRGDSITQAYRQQALRESYQQTREPVRSYAINTANTVALLSDLNFDSYQPAGGAVYPGTRSGRSLRAAAAIIKAQVGVEVITVELAYNNWDLHQTQSPFTGAMATEMSHLAECLNAFQRDMFAGAAPSFTLVAMSEFGRSLYENGSVGTDHGHGGLMFVLGGAVAGGRVLTQWPGLAPEQLYNGRDLEVTIDYRDIISEILAERVGNANTSAVFPGFTPTYRGVYA